MLSSSPISKVFGPIMAIGEGLGISPESSNPAAFAELLNGSKAANTDTGVVQGVAGNPEAVQPSQSANGPAGTAIRALVSRLRAGTAPSPAATTEQAATAGGKNLPLSLPASDEAPETESSPGNSGIEGVIEQGAAVAADFDPLVTLAAIAEVLGPPPPSPQPAAVPDGKTSDGVEGAVPGQTTPYEEANVASGRTMPRTTVAMPTAAILPAPSAWKPAPVVEGIQQVPAATPIAITARVESAPVAAPAAAPTPDLTATIKPKAPRLPEPTRVETPAAPLQMAASAVPQLDPTAVQTAPLAAQAPVSVPVPVPPLTDIAAALDHLAAAREALMPAEAALAIDHAEFGEVSIRIEQSREGRLSVELAAADPELQQAVSAAVGAERGISAGTDGDASRATGQTPQRNTTGNDRSSGDGSPSRNDRDAPQQRGQPQPRSTRGAEHTSAGVFA